MIQIFLLTTCITIIIFGIVYYNLLSVKINEPYTPVNVKDENLLANNFISNTIDTYYLQNKGQLIYDLKIKLNNLKEKLYNKKLGNILQLKTKLNKNNRKFVVKKNNNGFFNNIYTIEIPVGEIGPIGMIGERGDTGDKGDTGDMGPNGNCGLLIK